MPSGAAPLTRTYMRHPSQYPGEAAHEGRSGTLLYAATAAGMSVYSYPQGVRVGVITGFKYISGLCSDKNGDVFVVDAEAQEVLEYVHGGTTPIAVLDDSGNYPYGCAVDPSNGDLAVSGGNPPAHSEPNIAVYPQAEAPPTVYRDGSTGVLTYCTYDGKGNIFSVGLYDYRGAGEVVELPKGSSSFTNVAVNHEFNPGIHALQWDGRYLAVADPAEQGIGPNTIYEVAIAGSNGTVVNTVELDSRLKRGPHWGHQFWIADNRILSPESQKRGIGNWRYPRGGKPVNTIKAELSGSGITISDASRAR